MNNIKILDDNNIPYYIKYGSYKRLSIKVKDQKVIINYPYYLKESTVNSFIEKNLSLIKKYLNQEINNCNYEIGSNYLIMGDSYLIQYGDKLLIDENDKIIYVPSTNPNEIHQLLDKYCLSIVKDYYQMSLDKALIRMKDDLNIYPKLVVKRSVRNWGYAVPKKNLIMLNFSLIHVPYHLFEYVIYHELTHFKYLNHSKEFHNFLSSYIPDERKRQKELKKYAITY